LGKFLLTSDLHLTDRPQDAYRFDVFPWLKEQGKKHNVDFIGILGDLTDSKDNHNSTLVNKIVTSLGSLQGSCHKVFLLKGNHDYIDEDTPFFKFINVFDKVELIIEPAVQIWRKDRYLFLPHTKNPTEEWDFEFASYDCVFMHQTINGALASNGIKMKGLSETFLKDCKKVYSGDIHKPQKIGNIEYVGTPYHVRFNDRYEPRVILYDSEEGVKDLYFPCLKKHTLEIREPDDLFAYEKVSKGDQVKVRVKIRTADMLDWAGIRQQVVLNCEKMGVELFGVEVLPISRKKVSKDAESEQSVATQDYTQIFNKFCLKEGLDVRIRGIGKDLLEGFGGK
jgi:DNA repair exonuclease SbcCD nuclease subunit